MANSVTARFNDDCKVFVSMSDDTTVEKAVIIDAEGNETDIGGGGGGTSDFSTAEVTIKASDISIADSYLDFLPILENDGLRTQIELSLGAQEQITKTIVLYKGKTIVGSFGFYSIDSMSGNIALDDDEFYVITGDCSITISPAE